MPQPVQIADVTGQTAGGSHNGDRLVPVRGVAGAHTRSSHGAGGRMRGRVSGSEAPSFIPREWRALGDGDVRCSASPPPSGIGSSMRQEIQERHEGHNSAPAHIDTSIVKRCPSPSGAFAWASGVGAASR
ncbi:hypothetical protein T261_08292 [Streptomyces lydicus]|nr:hypothetical protein T261_08292 [Streptomyces lydicus]